MSVHFSSESSEWSTPQDLFDRLNSIYHFTLDPCATKENAKCKKFYTKKQDGLAQSWRGENVFMNPPYGRQIYDWMEKAYCEPANVVVCLVPARTDTQWWHQFATQGHIHYIEGRIRFGSHKNAAPFPSALVTFGDFF